MGNAVLQRLCGTTDLDEIFAYPTIRMVTIVDRRLGMLRYLLVLGIIGYIVIYQLAYQGAYLATSLPSGQARFGVLQPTTTCDMHQRSNSSADCTVGCDPDQAGCYDDFNNVLNLSYCEQSEIPYPYEKLPCHFQEYSGASVQFQSSLLLVSRAHQMTEVKQCSANLTDPLGQGGSCDKVYNVSDSHYYYFADIERFNVSLVHSMYYIPVGGSVPHDIKTSTDLSGALYVPHNHELCAKQGGVSGFPKHQNPTSSAPCYIMTNVTAVGADFFSLDTLLGAADLTLDDDSGEVDGKKKSGSSLRYEGLTLIISITYSNWRYWEVPGDTSYVYRVNIARGNHPRNTRAIYDSYPGKRTVLKLHGVQLVATQAGLLYSWDFTQFLLTLTTSLTLLAVATTVTDYIAVYAMPDSKFYSKYKYVKTRDFSTLRDVAQRMEDEGMDEDAVEKRLLAGIGSSPNAADSRWRELSDRLERVEALLPVTSS